VRCELIGFASLLTLTVIVHRPHPDPSLVLVPSNLPPHPHSPWLAVQVNCVHVQHSSKRHLQLVWKRAQGVPGGVPGEVERVAGPCVVSGKFICCIGHVGHLQEPLSPGTCREHGCRERTCTALSDSYSVVWFPYRLVFANTRHSHGACSNPTAHSCCGTRAYLPRGTKHVAICM
jgi:hypothetical protein